MACIVAHLTIQNNGSHCASKDILGRERSQREKRRRRLKAGRKGLGVRVGCYEGSCQEVGVEEVVGGLEKIRVGMGERRWRGGGASCDA